VIGLDLMSFGNAESITGPLVDKFYCDDLNGIALDTGKNLQADPFQHTVHCLSEISVCRNSGFYIFHKPDGASKWEVLHDLTLEQNHAAIEELFTLLPPERELSSLLSLWKGKKMMSMTKIILTTMKWSIFRKRRHHCSSSFFFLFSWL